MATVKLTAPPSNVSVYCMQDELVGAFSIFKSNNNPIVLDVYIHPLSHHYTAYAKNFEI